MSHSALAHACDYIQEQPSASKEGAPRVASHSVQSGEGLWAPESWERVGWAHTAQGMVLSTFLIAPDETTFTVGFVDQPSPSAVMGAAEEPVWREAAVLGLARVLGLPEGWDSCGAPRIQQKAVNSAFTLLDSAASDAVPPPAVVPTSDGGVQLEWHAWGTDVELVVPPHEAPELFFRDHHSGTEWEQELGANLAPLREALKVVAGRAGKSGR